MPFCVSVCIIEFCKQFDSHGAQDHRTASYAICQPLLSDFSPNTYARIPTNYNFKLITKNHSTPVDLCLDISK